MKKKFSRHVELALNTIEEYVRTGRVIPVPEDTPDELLRDRAGVFVSLHKHRQLRGCIGTIQPTTDSIAAEIIRNAVSACSRDWRFEPVQPDELRHLECSVDVLEPAEPVSDIAGMDPKVYGVIVKKGTRRGLLLPNLDGVDTAEQQISIALRKADISENESYELLRFKVTRHN